MPTLYYYNTSTSAWEPAIVGEIGATGPAGLSGNDGATGATGVTGVDGATGATGLQGATGAQGSPGASVTFKGSVADLTALNAISSPDVGDSYIVEADGDLYAWNGSAWTSVGQIVGPVGATGAAGVDGATGATGPAGVNGNDGATGATGAAGVDGATGATGPAGVNGNDGATGATGPAGSNGNDGATGASGLNGNDGATGATGPAGSNGNNGATGATGPAGAGATGATGPAGAGGALGYYGSFYDTSDQPLVSITAEQVIGINTTSESSGVSIADGSKITFANAGTYSITYSIQFVNIDNNTTFTADVWAKLNGNLLADSNSRFDVPGRHNGLNGHLIGTVNYVLTVNAGDYIQFYWTADSLTVSIETIPAGTNPTTPLTPGIIVTAVQVMYTQAGATGPAGTNGSNGATGATGVDGTNGATGATGPAGSNGANGATGATGVAGTNGATGATGPQGATGPAGPNVYTDTLQTVTDRGFTTTNRINITNTTDATSTTTAALTVAGGVGIGGDIFIQGNANGTSVAVFGVPAGFAVLPSTVVQATANVNAYVQNNFQNLNNGTQASADIVITAATGTDLNNYLDLGMTSGAWNGTQANSLGTALGGNDGYLYVQGGTGGGNLVIGTTSAGKYLKIVAEGTGTNSVVATFRAPNTVSTNTLTGSLTVAGGVGIGGNLYVSNLAIFEQVVEAFNAYSTTINNAAVVALDCNNGNIFNITSTVNGNWTANFTNLSLNSGYGTNVILVINQGATPYIPTALQIGGASQTINWQGGSAPTGSANKKDVISYSILSTAANTYMVLAQLVSFG